MRKNVTLASVLVMLCLFAIGQSQKVTGRISDNQGNPIPFATITKEGTKTATVADANGIFSINAEPNSHLLVTASGYQTQRLTVDGNTVNVTMAVVQEQLKEVLVTAFGIRASKKSVGFAAQDVTGAEINQAGSTNTVSALSGKVAGLEITNSSGTPGAAAYIKLRGFTSLGGGQPLMVVDGVPIDNSTNGISLGNVAQSNRGVDLNPDDIESISVLKGPAASALYGTQGTDGVILITTKRGKRAAGPSKFDVTYSYGVTFDHVSNLPALQMKYSQGTGGNYRSPAQRTSTSFGALNDTLMWTGVPTVWDPHGDIVGKSNPAGKIPVVPYDNLKQFFRVGVTQQHNVAVSSGNENNSFRLSYSNLYQEGIVPTSTFQRNTVTFSADSKLNENFKTGATLSYINSGGNRVQEGSNTSGILLGLARTPNTFDNSYGSSDPRNLASYQLPNGMERTYRGSGNGINAYYDNPYWTINKNLFRDQVNRLLGNIYLTYNPKSWISVTDRLGTDLYTDNRKQDFAIYSAAQKPGQVIYNNIDYRHVNNDLLLTLSKQNIAKDLNGSLLLGNNMYSESYSANTAIGTGFTIPDFYDLGNTSQQQAGYTSYLLRRVAFFADLKLDFSSFLFVDLTAREENSSAFISNLHNKGVYSFFPSASGSFVFTDAFHMNSKALSFGKLRASYGQAGRLPGVYSTSTYFASAVVGDGWTNGNTYPINGQQGFFAGALGNPNLKPERTSSVDLGTDLRFANNRIELNFTYYKSKSKDLLLFVPISPSSGYGSEYTNAASIENHGIEVTLTGNPVKTKDFNWNVIINYSMNRSLVTALGPGIQTLFLGGFSNGGISAVAGQPFGQIYGIGYVKDPATGKTVINDQPGSTFGYPVTDPNSRALGNPNPKWIGGIQNSFSYKHFNLRFLFDTKQKFDMWNGTRGALVNFGTAAETVNRGQNTVFDGVYGHTDANGNLVNGAANKPGAGAINTTVVQPNQAWYQGGGSGFNVNEPYIEDASFVKLRELAIGYDFDLSQSGARRYVKGISVTLIGRNLLLFTKYKGVDPDTGLAGPTAAGIDYFNNPGTRSYGLNVKVNL